MKKNIKIKIYLSLFISLITLSVLFYNNLTKTNIKIEKQSKHYKINNIKNINYISLKSNELISTKNNIFKITQNKVKKIIIDKNFKINDITLNNNFLLINTLNNKIIIIKNSKPQLKKHINTYGTTTSNVKLTNNKIFFNMNDRKILSINIKKNKILWQTLTNQNNIDITTESKILVSNNKIYQIIPNKKIIIIKKKNGVILTIKDIKINTNALQHDYIYKNIKKIQIYKNTIYICYSDGNFIALNGTNGKFLWQKTKKNYKNFVINKNTLIVLKNNGNFTSLNPHSGKKNWTNRSLNTQIIESASINKKNMIMINKAGTIHIINNSTGYITKSIKINKYNIKTSFLKKNVLILIKKNGNLIKLTKNKDK